MPAAQAHHQEALLTDFDRQVEALLEKGYPSAAGLKPEELLAHVGPLKDRLDELVAPFVLVVKSELVARDRAIELVKRREKAGTWLGTASCASRVG